MRTLLCLLSFCLGSAVAADDAKKDDDGFQPVRIDNYPTFTNTSQEPVLLRYKLKADQKIVTSIDVDMKMIIKQGGQTLDMKMPMVMDASAVVKAVDGEGNMSVDLKITRVRLKMDISGPQAAKREFDSDKKDADPAFAALRSIIDVKIPCKISATGRTLESDTGPLVRVLEEGGNAAIAKQIKDSTGQLIEGAFIQLNEKPVKVGDTYKGGSTNRGGVAKTNITYKVRAVSGDKSQVVLEPITDFQFNADAFPGTAVKVRKQDSGGWLLFDLKNGYSSKSFADVSMLLDITAGGETGSMTMKVATVVTTSLK